MSSATPSGSSGPPHTDAASDSSLSWEGERMFNIYIYDYCTKRGFNKTASELKIEADLGNDAHPPINAKQGLLFEWWSVFWQLFGAKSQGNGSEDAILYTQHQQAAARDRRPMGLNPGAQPPRLPNGAPASRPSALVPSLSMTNGVTPGSVPAGQGPQAGPFNGVNNQMNGMPNGTAATAPSPAQSGTFTPMLSNPPPGQMRPQQRPPNGVGPFQSPTMAHSPQNPGQQHPNAQMNQMGTPQMPTMARGGMLPPNGAQGVMPNSAHHTPQPSYRSPSRPSTPGQNPLIHASPSMTARPNPNNMSSADMRQVEAINNEFRTITAPAMQQLRQETGLGDKDPQSFTIEEKQRIITAYRAKRNQNQKPPQGQSNAVAGPSGTPLMPSRLQPNQQPGPNQGAGPGQRPIKRNSTSPPEEDILPRTESSPPDRKRVRRTPNPEQQQQGQPQQPQQQQPPMVPFPHAVPQSGGPHMANGLMRPPQPMGGPQMGGFPVQAGMPNMGNNPGMNMGMGQMPQNVMNAMNPGMLNHGMVQPQTYQYSRSMANLHKNGLQQPQGMNQGMNMLPNQNTASPHSNDGGFNVDGSQGRGQPFPGGVPTNRMPAPNKMSGMPPPPSPAMNGMSKGPATGPKTEPGSDQGMLNSRSEGSPRNAAAGIGQGQGQQQSNSGQPSTAPPTPATNGLTTPSPAQIINSTASGMSSSASATDLTTNLFSTDFMGSLGQGFDDIDPSAFLRESDINFERDFGQWFNPDDVALDMSK